MQDRVLEAQSTWRLGPPVAVYLALILVPQIWIRIRILIRTSLLRTENSTQQLYVKWNLHSQWGYQFFECNEWKMRGNIWKSIRREISLTHFQKLLNILCTVHQHDMKILNYMLCDCVKSTEGKRNPSNPPDLCNADDGCKMPGKLRASIHCFLNQNTETGGNCGF